MKAVRVTKDGSSTSLSISDLEKPTPGPGELLVKIRASAISPADVLNSKGSFGMTTFPRTLGRDFAGTVIEGSDGWKGKNVFGTSGDSFSFTVDGAQAEYAILKQDCVAMMPTTIEFAQAAIMGTPFTTASLTLSRASIKSSDAVLVLGATGSVGSVIMQLAAAHGCKTISVGRHGTDVNSVEDPSLQRAKELTVGKGPDIVVDTVGDFTLVHAAIEIMAYEGRFVTITAPRSGSTQIPVDILDLYRRGLSLVGCNSASQPQQIMARMLSEMVPMIESGKLKAPDLKGWEKIPIERALEAYEGKVKKGVIVFD